MNQLYYGDNLDVLRQQIGDESVDLVYLDPPFKSDQNYEVLFQRQGAARRATRLEAFGDTWCWDDASAQAFQEVVAGGGRVGDVMRAFRLALGDNDMLAYLSMMAPRLIELHRVLRPTGTIYLHCDPSASHYLKILMDAVFGPANMRNEIVWCYRGGGVPKKDFARKHDLIFRYSKTGDYWFDVDAVRIPYSDDVLKSSPSRYDKSYRANKVYEGYRPHPAGKHPEDWWAIQAILPSSHERLGYPTQKPEKLLERIIKASSRAGDTVLDPFSGCGTTIAVAQRLGRRWIGIDVTHLAISLIKFRLHDAAGPAVAYEVKGEPTDPAAAQALAQSNRQQFRWWALSLVAGARPTEQKKRVAGRIDGRLFFRDEAAAQHSKQAVFQVTAAAVGVAEVRQLDDIVRREQAQMGVLITAGQPAPSTSRAAAAAGLYRSPAGSQHPRLQVYSVAELLAGRRVDLPGTPPAG